MLTLEFTSVRDAIIFGADVDGGARDAMRALGLYSSGSQAKIQVDHVMHIHNTSSITIRITGNSGSNLKITRCNRSLCDDPRPKKIFVGDDIGHCSTMKHRF